MAEAHGILAPQLGIKPTPPALEDEILTTGPPGKSLDPLRCKLSHAYVLNTVFSFILLHFSVFFSSSVAVWLVFFKVISLDGDLEVIFSESSTILLLLQKMQSTKITINGDCSHEIKRCLLFGRKAMTNLDSILKRRVITLPTKVHIIKAMVFPIIMYRYGHWIIKKRECQG